MANGRHTVAVFPALLLLDAIGSRTAENRSVTGSISKRYSDLYYHCGIEDKCCGLICQHFRRNLDEEQDITNSGKYKLDHNIFYEQSV